MSSWKEKVFFYIANIFYKNNDFGWLCLIILSPSACLEIKGLYFIRRARLFDVILKSFKEGDGRKHRSKITEAASEGDNTSFLLTGNFTIQMHSLFTKRLLSFSPNIEN